MQIDKNLERQTEEEKNREKKEIERFNIARRQKNTTKVFQRNMLDSYAWFSY